MLRIRDALFIMATKLYSPRQATLASFIGGPFAAVYILRENFTALEQPARSRAALLWGGGFILALFAILPFLPAEFPNLVLPIAYSVTVGELVKIYQLSKDKIQQSDVYQFQSNWRVAGVSVAALVLLAVLMVILTLVLGYLGAIEL